MALSYTSDQEQIRAEARRFLEDSFKSDVNRALLRQRGAYDVGFWRACIDMGWTGAGVPETFGGLGLGAVDVCIIAEECGRFIAAAPFLAANYSAMIALQDYADEDVRAALAPKIASGDARFALAFFEGDDNLARPTASFSDGALSGAKVAVAGAGAASHAVVSTGDGLALVDLSHASVTRAAGDTIDNSRCAADITFDKTPATLIAAPKQAPLRLLAVQATLTAFEQIGGAEAAMARAQSYANTREAFGQPIGKFQAIKHRIAEMYVAIQLARGNALLAATGLNEVAPDFVARAAAARLAASDAFEFSAAQSMQTHGAIGVTWEHDLHLYLRRARAQALELGSSLFWEDVLVDALQDAH